MTAAATGPVEESQHDCNDADDDRALDVLLESLLPARMQQQQQPPPPTTATLHYCGTTAATAQPNNRRGTEADQEAVKLLLPCQAALLHPHGLRRRSSATTVATESLMKSPMMKSGNDGGNAAASRLAADSCTSSEGSPELLSQRGVGKLNGSSSSSSLSSRGEGQSQSCVRRPSWGPANPTAADQDGAGSPVEYADDAYLRAGGRPYDGRTLGSCHMIPANAMWMVGGVNGQTTQTGVLGSSDSPLVTGLSESVRLLASSWNGAGGHWADDGAAATVGRGTPSSDLLLQCSRRQRLERGLPRDWRF
eukprot:GHVU01131293.1.p1 GENE.GHVU01131293.1~~GHVU01131293.1.p1  ORF type:complete len:324 (+),score=52.41 GHVU01131293.1:52-972(+)